MVSLHFMVAPQWIHLVSAQVVTNWKRPVSGQRCRHGFLDMSKFGATGWSWQDWVRVEWVMVLPEGFRACCRCLGPYESPAAEKGMLIIKGMVHE